jgi:hypothetical protein
MPKSTQGSEKRRPVKGSSGGRMPGKPAAPPVSQVQFLVASITSSAKPKVTME